MHTSIATVTLFSFLPALILAMPAATTSPKPAAAMATGTSGVSDKQVMNAVLSWMNDTGKVSKFLNTATSFSGDEFTRQATIALNSEKDELNHKMVLDTALGQMDSVKAANDTLATQGTFQAVVDALQFMVDNGPDTAQMQVDAINQNRCVNVLPNIDAYFAAAGSPDIKSVQPSGCLEVNNAAASPAASSNSTDPAASAPKPKATTAAPAQMAAPSGEASTASSKSSAAMKASAQMAAPSGNAAPSASKAGSVGKASAQMAAPTGQATSSGAKAAAASKTTSSAAKAKASV